MSKHEQYILKREDHHLIFRIKGKRKGKRHEVDKRYVVLKYNRLEYTKENLALLSKQIRSSLSDDLLSRKFCEDYPVGHERRKRRFFGYCVPATFACLYFMDTDLLVPVTGKDETGEGHWWLVDKSTNEIIDLTKEQFTDDELVQVYATGKPKGYYGGRNPNYEMPASRFFRLMHKVQPTSVLYETNDPDAEDNNLTEFLINGE